ncbi:hypothetical protein ABGB09_31445 [Streptomyces sp. B8F3]|uniref:hypothetical protein n=1 Tax=Streptomyces sp. B8F3 TaxID=3153573 RepID=UPI00325C8785
MYPICTISPSFPDHCTKDTSHATTPAGTDTDRRLIQMLAEAYRHAKPLGGPADSTRALDAPGCPPDAPEIALADDPRVVLDDIAELLTRHRVGDRTPPRAAARRWSASACRPSRR